MHAREAAERIESNPGLPRGTEERFGGYGLMGLPFRSGHVLAMRRFPASSVGPGYTSLWHRTPEGSWAFYADAPLAMACTRFFGCVATTAIQTEVTLQWLGPNRLRMAVASAGLECEIETRETVVTRAMNGFMGLLPTAAWRSKAVLSAMGAVAGVAMSAGRVRLTGTAPNGQAFVANPYRLWLVSEAHASVHGEDLGRPGALRSQARLQDFWIPQQGIFALGRAYFEPFDAALHSSQTTSTSSKGGSR
jgi:hypothetical protein